MKAGWLAGTEQALAVCDEGLKGEVGEERRTQLESARIPFWVRSRENTLERRASTANPAGDGQPAVRCSPALWLWLCAAQLCVCALLKPSSTRTAPGQRRPHVPERRAPARLPNQSAAGLLPPAYCCRLHRSAPTSSFAMPSLGLLCRRQSSVVIRSAVKVLVLVL